MSVTIQTFVSGDTSYISKHNTNYANIKAAIEALQAAVTSGGGGGEEGTSSLPVAYEAFFGAADALIGQGSYVPSSSVAHQLSVTAGYAYDAATDAVVTKSTATTLNLLGQTTGTYYIHVDQYGVPYFDAISASALYSVAYNQETGVFSSITRVSPLFDTAADQSGERTNLWSVSYPSIDARIDGAEKASFYVLERTIVAADFEITTQEAFEQHIVLLHNGPQTADVVMTVPAAKRVYTIVNSASASYTVAVTPDAGTGYPLPGNYYAVLYCSGTAVTPIFLLDLSLGGATASTFIDLVDAPSTYTGNASKAVRVNSGETALEFYTPAGATSVDDSPVDGATTAAISSNWAFDHTANTTAHPDVDDTPVDGATSSAASSNWAYDHAADTSAHGISKVFYPAGFYPSAPTTSQVMLHLVAVGATTFPSGLTASQGFADTAATAQTDFDLQKNGVSVGTMRFAASGTVASFIAASPIALVAGDRLKVVAPDTPDATLAGITFTLAGTRS